MDGGPQIMAPRFEKEEDSLVAGVMNLGAVAGAGCGLLGLAGGASPEPRWMQSVEKVPFVGETETELTREELIIILEGLGQYSNTIEENGRKLLGHIIHNFSKYLTWVGTALTGMSTAIIFLNIIRYFYQQLRLRAQEGENVGSGELHIVLVSKGSFNDQVRPADWLVPSDSITDTILYCPWNCSINGKVAYSIATGDIQLHHRDFRSNQEPTHQLLVPDVPDHWNSIRALPPQPVPEIELGPMQTNADWISQLMALADQRRLYNRRNRLIIPYPPGGLTAFLPKVPLYQIIGVIEILLKVIPPYKATIHLAAGLQYGGSTQPDEEMLEEQYAYTPHGTVMTTQNMQFTDLEFPMFYGVLRSIFH